ncbi:MAG: hypothetical protein ACRC67_18185 [Inquilinus sp.]|uniref:hypothetical protein n=1 Tax=Inquilinus sp. TaxID=1932117 RepID=UPI003F2F3217
MQITDLPRFDGAAAWSALAAETQAAIGAAVLEMAVAWFGQDAAGEDRDATRGRLFEDAAGLATDRMTDLAADALPGNLQFAEVVPVPSIVGDLAAWEAADKAGA